MFLNDANVEKEIRTIEVSSFVSKVAEISSSCQTVEQHKKKWARTKESLWTAET
jgi:cytidylate kinase